MAEAATAFGIASFGIQICGTLLAYCDRWKDYDSDTSSAIQSVAELDETLKLLKNSLADEALDQARKGQVEKRIQASKDDFGKLSEVCEELRQYEDPDGFRQRAWASIQRAQYPLRIHTLVKARETIDGALKRLLLAIQVLHLDMDIHSQRTLGQLAAVTRDTASSVLTVEASLALNSTQTQSILETQREEQLKRIVAWLSPPNPWTNHESARLRCEPGTGQWLLDCDQYQTWKSDSSTHRCLWLYGKAGCGKTVLCSTAIEDARKQCISSANAAVAIFYFAFSDSHKQSYRDLLCSLVSQVGWKEPGYSMLVQAYEKPDRRLPRLDELERILCSSVASFDTAFVLLDALDECSEADEARETVIVGLGRLLSKVPNLKILITSRETSDVRESMPTLGSISLPIASQSVDADIQRWLSSQLSQNRKLARLDAATQALIQQTISEKADGMFRWAYCQLEELQRLKSTRPKYIELVLRNLPSTLDATYERMLVSIEEMYREEVLTLLRWLTYAQSPLSLEELAEAAIIDPESGVDVANRGSLEDVLEILSGLVIVQAASIDDIHGNALENGAIQGQKGDIGATESIPENDELGMLRAHVGFNRYSKIRLAHFSVKEYLESKRILQSKARNFHLESGKDHKFLAQSCLTYLHHYSCSEMKTSTKLDLVAFPLLKYAAQSWFYHSALQSPADEVEHEVDFLTSEAARLNWLRVHQPDRKTEESFTSSVDGGSGLYYAAFLGLVRVVQTLVDPETVNAAGGRYGNPLQAAAVRGEGQVLEVLLDAGANVNIQGGQYYNALQAAVCQGRSSIAKVLIDAGANVQAESAFYGTALHVAAFFGESEVAKMLIDAGADVNAKRPIFGDALGAATARGELEVMRILIHAGAEINVKRGWTGYALHQAAFLGNVEAVEMLIQSGADVSAKGGPHGCALRAALAGGHDNIVTMLKDAGAKDTSE